MCPPSRPERESERSRLTFDPRRIPPSVVFESVSFEASAVNVPAPFRVTVRQTPETATESPSANVSTGWFVATVIAVPARNGDREATVPTSSTIPVNILLPLLRNDLEVRADAADRSEGEALPGGRRSARPARHGADPFAQEQGRDEDDVPVDRAFRHEPAGDPPASLDQEGRYTFRPEGGQEIARAHGPAARREPEHPSPRAPYRPHVVLRDTVRAGDDHLASPLAKEFPARELRGARREDHPPGFVPTGDARGQKRI